LKRQILIRTINAQKIVDYFNENGKDVSVLETILSELNSMVEEVDSVVSGEIQISVERFVDLKKNSEDLIRQFREEVHANTDESDRSEIRERFNAVNSEEIQDINEEIREAMMFLRQNQVQRILNHIGVNDVAILRMVASGEITVDELRLRLRNVYNDLSEERKEDVRVRIREDRVEIREERREKFVNEIGEKIERRVEIRERVRDDGRIEVERRTRDRISNSGSGSSDDNSNSGSDSDNSGSGNSDDSGENEI
jgi:ElaB/YqjD/DUF883 family membrane-anchored ribosome-binding protein